MTAFANMTKGSDVCSGLVFSIYNTFYPLLEQQLQSADIYTCLSENNWNRPIEMTQHSPFRQAEDKGEIIL
jgi:hypothetical protein